MQKVLFRTLLAATTFGAAFAAELPKKPADIPVETIFKRAEYAEMELSPNGKLLAALLPYKGRNNIAVIDLEKRTQNLVTGFDNVDAANFVWVNNERLCLRVADTQEVSGRFNYKGTFCVNYDGSGLRDFTKLGVTNPAHGGYTAIRFLAPIPDGGEDYIVEMALRSRDVRGRGGSLDVYRFNTGTGRYHMLTEDSPGDVGKWVLDRNLVPRVAVSVPERKDRDSPRVATVWYRDGEGSKWEKIHESRQSWVDDDTFEPLAFDYDNKTLYVATNKGRDRDAIYKYDTGKRELGELVFEHRLIDLDRELVFSRTKKKLVGILYSADKQGATWIDEDFDRMQRTIDASFPRTVNLMSLPRDGGRRALVFSFSDVDPGTYYLYDPDKRTVEMLAKSREWIDPALMAERRFIVYKARDGMEIPAWVTIPKGGGKNLPLVVNIHGGPWVRGYQWTSWGRWPEAQFFASRGYVVLEPEPRGSTGWGRKHFFSSLKQLGLAMQDDITDGALHLVKEGLVDKGRMCLHGGSYGGYATLEGLAKEPDLWKCGTPFVAVSDLGLWQSVPQSDTAQFSDFLDTDFRHLVGDKDADRALFDKVSPARNADKFKAPVLLAMGSDDVRVPIDHGIAMKSALEKAGKKVEYVVYPGEGHGFNLDEHVFDHYRRIEKFLAQYLKPAPN